MHKAIEYLTLLDEKPSVKFRLLESTISNSYVKLGVKDVTAIFEFCLTCIVSTQMVDVDKLGIYIYRTYGQQYPRVLRSFCSYNKVNTVISNIEWQIGRRYLWLTETIFMFPDQYDSFVIMNQHQISRLLDTSFWESELDDVIEFLPYVSEIYTAWPFLLPKDIDARTKLQLKVIKKLANSELKKDHRRAMLLFIEPLIDVLWSNRSKKEMYATASDIIHRLSQDDINSNVTMSCIIPYIDVMAYDSIKHCNQKMDLLFVLENMIKWLLAPSPYSKPESVAKWFRIIVEHLYTSGHGDIPYQLAKSRLNLVLSHILVPSLSDGLLSAFKTLSLSCKRSPVAFHNVIPLLIEVFTVTQTEPNLNRPQHLEALAVTTHCLMHMFPNYPAFYNPLNKLLKDFTKPTITEIQEELEAHNWEKPTKTEKYDIDHIEVKKGKYKTFIQKAISSDLTEQVRDNMIKRTCGLRNIQIKDEDYESPKDIFKNLYADMLACDYLAIADNLKKSQSTATCCHMDHDWKVRRKFADEHFNKLFTWPW